MNTILFKYITHTFACISVYAEEQIVAFHSYEILSFCIYIYNSNEILRHTITSGK